MAHLFVLCIVCYLCLLTVSTVAKSDEQTSNMDDSRESGKDNQKPEEKHYSNSSTGKKGSFDYEEEENMSEEYIKKMREKQEEARRRRRMNERKKSGSGAAQRIIQAGKSDRCDWRQNPWAFLKGEICGAHYKVLGLNRKRDVVDKPSVKKAYRQATLTVHPDKNPAEEAETAFKIVQGAYECLYDDFCKDSYDHQLNRMEEDISWRRLKFRSRITEQAMKLLNYLHYYVSISAHHIFRTALDIWEWVDQWQFSLFGEDWPLGRPALAIALLYKGQIFLKILLVAYLIERVNYEIAKYRGLI